MRTRSPNAEYALNYTGACPFCAHQNERGNVCAHFWHTGFERTGERYFHFKRRLDRSEVRRRRR